METGRNIGIFLDMIMNWILPLEWPVADTDLHANLTS
jgi:hypothetical protein